MESVAALSTATSAAEAGADVRAALRNGPYQLFMLALCTAAIGVLAAETLVDLDAATKSVLGYVDDAVCVVFLIDFGVTLLRGPNRWKYLVTWGWLDALSSIPAWPLLRLGRAGRALRILRLLRAARAGRALARAVLERRAQSACLAAILLTLLVVALTSIAVLHVEHGANGATIRTAEDAAWWAVSTLTTVGYGDVYPVTSEGRAIGLLLMSMGFCLVATMSGLFASWFIGQRTCHHDAEFALMHAALLELRQEVSSTTASATGLPRAASGVPVPGARDVTAQGSGNPVVLSRGA